MKPRMPASAALAVSTFALFVLVTSCSDDSTSGTSGTSSSGAASSSGTASSSGATSSSGGSSGTTSSSGGSSGSTDAGNDAAGACNTLVNDGAQVPETQVGGSPPAMTGGGPLPDGTYVLTARDDYQGSCNCLEKRKLVITGTTVNYVTQTDNKPEEHLTGTASFSGNEVTITFTCGPAASIGKMLKVQYTYAAPTYRTYDTNGGKSQLETYTKQ